MLQDIDTSPSTTEDDQQSVTVTVLNEYETSPDPSNSNSDINAIADEENTNANSQEEREGDGEGERERERESEGEENAESRTIKADVSPAPSTTTASQVGVIEENYDDEPDETIAERLWGLTEMFPDPVRDYAGKMTKITADAVKKFFAASCRLIWVISSSSVILFAPVILEAERAKIRENQISQQKHVLLGPAAVVSANPIGVSGRGGAVH